MNINEINRIGSLNPYTKNTEARANEREVKPNRKDEVHISKEALELLGAKGQTNDAQRADKINELKQAVSTGTYHVDTGKLAEAIWPFLE